MGAQERYEKRIERSWKIQSGWHKEGFVININKPRAIDPTKKRTYKKPKVAEERTGCCLQPVYTA